MKGTAGNTVTRSAVKSSSTWRRRKRGRRSRLAPARSAARRALPSPCACESGTTPSTTSALVRPVAVKKFSASHQRFACVRTTRWGRAERARRRRDERGVVRTRRGDGSGRRSMRRPARDGEAARRRRSAGSGRGGDRGRRARSAPRPGCRQRGAGALPREPPPAPETPSRRRRARRESSRRRRRQFGSAIATRSLRPMPASGARRRRRRPAPRAIGSRARRARRRRRAASGRAPPPHRARTGRCRGQRSVARWSSTPKPARSTPIRPCRTACCVMCACTSVIPGLVDAVLAFDVSTREDRLHAGTRVRVGNRRRHLSHHDVPRAVAKHGQSVPRPRRRADADLDRAPRALRGYVGRSRPAARSLSSPLRRRPAFRGRRVRGAERLALACAERDAAGIDANGHHLARGRGGALAARRR